MCGSESGLKAEPQEQTPGATTAHSGAQGTPRAWRRPRVQVSDGGLQCLKSPSRNPPATLWVLRVLVTLSQYLG